LPISALKELKLLELAESCIANNESIQNTCDKCILHPKKNQTMQLIFKILSPLESSLISKWTCTIFSITP